MEHDYKRKDLLLAIGEGLHVWSWVEVELSNLYMILQQIKRDEYSNPLRLSFESVISLEVRLAMTAAYIAADDTIRDNYLPHFKALSARISKLYKKRHELAHFMIVGREKCGGNIYPVVKPFFTVDAFQQRKGPELELEQIKERVAKFADLSSLIRRHIQHVGALRGLPLTHYAREGDIAFPPLDASDLNPPTPVPPKKSSPE